MSSRVRSVAPRYLGALSAMAVFSTSRARTCPPTTYYTALVRDLSMFTPEVEVLPSYAGVLWGQDYGRDHPGDSLLQIVWEFLDWRIISSQL